jgi:hypothetical protein
MWPDPKWLEYIKPGSDIALALFLACLLGLLGEHWRWFPQLAPWINQLFWLGLIIFGSFTVVGVMGAWLGRRY